MLNKSDWVSFFPKSTGELSRNYSLWDIMTLDQTDMTQFHHMWLGIFTWTTVIVTIVYALAFVISFLNLHHHSWIVFSLLPFLLLLIIPQFLLNLTTCAVIALSFSAGGKAITAWHCLGIGCMQSLFSILDFQHLISMSMIINFLSTKYISLDVFNENEYIFKENNTIGCFIFNICEVIFIFFEKMFEIGLLFLSILRTIFEKNLFLKKINNFIQYLTMILKELINITTIMYNHSFWWLIDNDSIGFSKLSKKEVTKEYGENTRLLLASFTTNFTTKEILNDRSIFCRK